MPATQAVDGHTHGVSAAQRSGASTFADLLGSVSGYTALFFSGSGADSRSGRAYTRSYYWLKDLMAPANWDVVERPLNVMIDVDYYANMEKLLGLSAQPWLMYTFVPNHAAKSDGDYSYTFLADGSVRYSVSGGGEYTHQVWNWDGDSMGCVAKWLGIPWCFTGYALERRQVDADHQLVLLSPLVHTSNPLTTIVVRWLLAYRSPTRINPIQGDFVRLLINGSDGMYRCTSKVGCYTAAKVRVQVDDAIISAQKTTSGKLSLATVKSKIDSDNSGMREFPGAEILLEYHLSGMSAEEPRVSVLDAGVRRFQYVPEGHTYDADARPGMVSFMEPLLDGGFVPDSCRNNDQAFVDGRVKNVRSKELPIGKTLHKFMTEFATFLVPNPHQLRPCEEEEVYDRQSRPSQRQILNNSQNEHPDRRTRQFMKREAYQRVNHPRGISQINGTDKRIYSAYIYAFVDAFLKPLNWYAFAKKPVAVAWRVVAVCMACLVVCLTDFSRMDGRVSNVCRFLEKMIMLRAFAPQYHAEIMEQLRAQHHLPGKTSHGVNHKTLWERLSGSAETSAFNTIINACIMYVAIGSWVMSQMKRGRSWDYSEVTTD